MCGAADFCVRTTVSGSRGFILKNGHGKKAHGEHKKRLPRIARIFILFKFVGFVALLHLCGVQRNDTPNPCPNGPRCLPEIHGALRVQPELRRVAK
jgi:hypothetical protein